MKYKLYERGCSCFYHSRNCAGGNLKFLKYWTDLGKGHPLPDILTSILRINSNLNRYLCISASTVHRISALQILYC